MTEPLTRRELRERERRAAAEAAPPQAAPVPGRELRVQQSSVPGGEPTAERSAVRRRPVQPPAVTDSLTVLDPVTGTVSAVALTPVVDGPAQPAVAAPPATPAPAPAATPPAAPVPAATPMAAPVPAATPMAATPMAATPVAAPAPAAEPPSRRSLREPQPDPNPPLSVEQAAIAQRGVRSGRAALAGVLRFLVLLLAAAIIGAMIWVVADRASAVVTIAADLEQPAGENT